MAVRRDEAGAVTAETALVIPALVLLAAVLAWMVGIGVAQVRAVDAARETARSLARGDDQSASVEMGRRVAPDGATIDVREEGDEVIVTVRAAVGGPGPLFGLLPGHAVEAEAIAVREPGS